MSDNDLIRRGDALAACQGMDPEGDINAIPAVQPDVAALVEAAFQEGFLAGTADGWVNNPRIKMEWKRSRARAALARVKGVM